MPCVWDKSRLLKSVHDGTNTVQFAYDLFGRRTSKTCNSTVTEFEYDESKLIRQIGDDGIIEFIYGKNGIVGFVHNDKAYSFRKNLFGDVERIYDKDGKLVGKYSYTAFGECTIELDEGSIASLNPIRYRGYYFDDELGLYYLESRYYDPEIGRFISPDSIEYIDPEYVNGLNLYAYCDNNPIMNVDPEGTSVLSILILIYAFLCTSIGGLVTQFTASVVMYVGFTIASFFDPEIKADMDRISWNPYNANEELVLSSKKVSFYKGVPVFRFKSPVDGRSFTYAAMFLDEDISRRDNPVNEVRHEWGHAVAMTILGPLKYAITECIPSAAKWGPYAKNGNYYQSPVEMIADMFGGAFNNGSHFRTKDQEQVAIERFLVAKFFGVLSYLYFL